MSEKFKPCIAVADKDELEQVQWIVNNSKGLEHIPVIYTGLGMCASVASVFSFKKFNYDMIINIGTCGSKNLEPGTICEPSYFYMADMLIGDQLRLDPYNLNAKDAFTIIQSVKEDKVCFSSNSFVTWTSPIITRGYRGIFDMEAYGFKYASKIADISYVPIKVVTDSLSLSGHREHINVIKRQAKEISDILTNIYATGVHAVS